MYHKWSDLKRLRHTPEEVAEIEAEAAAEARKIESVKARLHARGIGEEDVADEEIMRLMSAPDEPTADAIVDEIRARLDHPPRSADSSPARSPSTLSSSPRRQRQTRL